MGAIRRKYMEIYGNIRKPWTFLLTLWHFMALKISKQVSDRFLVSMAMIIIFELLSIEGSLEVKLPIIWTDGRAEVGRIREEKRREGKRREEKRREEEEEEKRRRREEKKKIREEEEKRRRRRSEKKKRREEKRRGRSEKRREEKRKSQKKEGAGARKGRKVARHCVFPMFGGFRGSKSRLAKAAGVEPSG